MKAFKNAIIEDTQLGFERGILTFSLYLNYGTTSQIFQSPALDTSVKDDDGAFLHRTGTAKGMETIAKLLRVVGVNKWEDLKGKYIKVQLTSADYAGTIIRLHHILDGITEVLDKE